MLIITFWPHLCLSVTLRMDPFLITPQERARFVEQFNVLKPVGGIVTGEQAKGFFIQSQLPLPILGAIWYAESETQWYCKRLTVKRFCYWDTNVKSVIYVDNLENIL